MFIHLGDNEVLSLARVVVIVNLRTVDPATVARARGQVGELARSAVLTATGDGAFRWIGSSLSSVTLGSRGHRLALPGALWRRPRRKAPGASPRSGKRGHQTGVQP